MARCPWAPACAGATNSMRVKTPNAIALPAAGARRLRWGYLATPCAGFYDREVKTRHSSVSHLTLRHQKITHRAMGGNHSEEA
jgi:hypothetical protein